MLRITVELVPFGDESMAKTIGKGYIINDGTSRNNQANYDCIFKVIDKNQTENIKLKNFDRSKGFWSLIGNALKGK